MMTQAIKEIVNDDCTGGMHAGSDVDQLRQTGGHDDNSSNCRRL